MGHQRLARGIHGPGGEDGGRPADYATRARAVRDKSGVPADYATRAVRDKSGGPAEGSSTNSISARWTAAGAGFGDGGVSEGWGGGGDESGVGVKGGDEAEITKSPRPSIERFF